MRFHGGWGEGRRSFSGARRKTLLKIAEDGASFRLCVDANLHCISPEISIQIQREFGADIILASDECTPFHSTRDCTANFMDGSHRWEMRSLREFRKLSDGTQALYRIIQGGIYDDLPRESVQFISNKNSFGQAIGRSLWGTREQMQGIIANVCGYIKK
jgi:queuine tRNA-ribosyltransferase